MRAGLLAWMAVAVATGVAAAPRAPAPAPRPRPEVMRGITLSLFYPRDRAQVPASLERIAALGATHVSVPIPLWQDGVATTTVDWDPRRTPSDSLVARVVREAHARGLRVVLFPLLSLRETGPGRWRGALRPADWGAWFASYREQLLRCARVGRVAQADWLCVGAELASSVAHAGRWRQLIRSVRAAFPGCLMYSRNWDSTGGLAFGAELDLVGLNAYFELVGGQQPTAAALARRWAQIRRRLERRAGALGGRFVFTEVGYPSSERAAARPWDYLGPRTSRPDLQDLCFEAFFRAWAGDPRLAGAFVYLWSAREGDAGDPGYSIRGKPAERTVERWFKAGFPLADPDSARAPAPAK
ncbi:MAG TPA: hypothetical protein VMS93_05810 [Candidatus Saccharimonadales bacterium]|nr:hypothetical protein [Candidatus Saccharimonadales bacterium]